MQAGAQTPYEVKILVNQTPITEFEIEARTRLLQALVGGRGEKSAHRAQAVDELIDEALQLEQAEILGILPSLEDEEAGFANIAANNGFTPEEFEALLQNQNVPTVAFKSRIRPQLAWSAILAINAQGRDLVSDEELESQWAQIQDAKGQTQWLLTEIYIRDVSEEEANALAQQMRDNGNFSEFARTTSLSPSAAKGGDIGWKQAGELTPAQATAFQDLKAGQVSTAIPGHEGYFFYGIRDIRPVGALTIETRVELRRLFITLTDQGNSPEDAEKLLSLQTAFNRVDSCERFDQVSEIYGEQGSSDLGLIDPAQLPTFVQNAIEGLEEDQFSTLVPEPGGAAIYINCGSQVKPIPLTKDQLRERILNERIQAMGEDLMIGYRRQAYIEYR